ncbi:hypothetical protein L914_20301 [Phytophthora nicotianae]|uniref:EF-hand domain-containing protein n=2 Tax=Phytophthora nicotianae TaxID=4792 RepID=V9E6J2_PHYNI|nr:hypothetical protein F443_18879 [Phytophthora nicotianae P1569]ETM32251.1 hypothetical protein L914_20301 [Phytophthora nicotianae]
MPNGTKAKSPKVTNHTKASKDREARGAVPSKKKKISSHSTPKNGHSTKSKKRKNPSSIAAKELHEANDVELHTDSQAKTSAQRIQVKSKSTGEISATAVENAASDPGAINDTGGLASGQYDTLLQMKRAEKLCMSFGLQKRHVMALHRAFKREEQLGTGEITIGEFFTMLHEQPRQLTRGLFDAVGLAHDIKRLRFDDFVICIATIATWSKSELLQYAFKQFDVDESGVMDSRELRAFCEGLKNDSSFYFANNVSIARDKITARDHKHPSKQNPSEQLPVISDDEDDALVDLEDLMKGSDKFQVAFYPLMQLQQNVRGCALGEQFWAGVTVRRQHVDVVVQYMGNHKGKLPPTSAMTRIMALIPFSQAHTKMLVHKLAVLKYAEEQKRLQEQTAARVKAKQALQWGQDEDDNQDP